MQALMSPHASNDQFFLVFFFFFVCLLPDIHEFLRSIMSRLISLKLRSNRIH